LGKGKNASLRKEFGIERDFSNFRAGVYFELNDAQYEVK
jgi:hypothetical protein